MSIAIIMHFNLSYRTVTLAPSTKIPSAIMTMIIMTMAMTIPIKDDMTMITLLEYNVNDDNDKR